MVYVPLWACGSLARMAAHDGALAMARGLIGNRVPAAVHKATAHHAVSLQHAFAHGGGGNRENKRTCGRIALAEVLDELAARQLDVVAGVVAVRVGHCPLVPVCTVGACARACRPEVGASHDTGVPYLQRRRDAILATVFTQATCGGKGATSNWRAGRIC